VSIIKTLSTTPRKPRAQPIKSLAPSSKNYTITASLAKTPSSHKRTTLSPTMANQTSSDSANNRERLKNWAEKNKVENVSFWIPPNTMPTVDECVCEVVNALERSQDKIARGEMNPVGDDTHL